MKTSWFALLLAGFLLREEFLLGEDAERLIREARARDLGF